MPEPTIEELKKENIKLKIELTAVNKLISYYEGDGMAKLFYSLNRKSGEIADLLNKVNLSDIKLEDKDNKTFERMKVLWNEASGIATAVKSLEQTSGITNDEEKDTKNPKYQRTTPESIADVFGDNKGQEV